MGRRRKTTTNLDVLRSPANYHTKHLRKSTGTNRKSMNNIRLSSANETEPIIENVLDLNSNRVLPDDNIIEIVKSIGGLGQVIINLIFYSRSQIDDNYLKNLWEEFTNLKRSHGFDYSFLKKGYLAEMGLPKKQETLNIERRNFKLSNIATFTYLLYQQSKVTESSDGPISTESIREVWDQFLGFMEFQSGTVSLETTKMFLEVTTQLYILSQKRIHANYQSNHPLKDSVHQKMINEINQLSQELFPSSKISKLKANKASSIYWTKHRRERRDLLNTLSIEQMEKQFPYQDFLNVIFSYFINWDKYNYKENDSSADSVADLSGVMDNESNKGGGVEDINEGNNDIIKEEKIGESDDNNEDSSEDGEAVLAQLETGKSFGLNTNTSTTDSTDIAREETDPNDNSTNSSRNITNDPYRHELEDDMAILDLDINVQPSGDESHPISAGNKENDEVDQLNSNDDDYNSLFDEPPDAESTFINNKSRNYDKRNISLEVNNYNSRIMPTNDISDSESNIDENIRFGEVDENDYGNESITNTSRLSTHDVRDKIVESMADIVSDGSVSSSQSSSIIQQQLSQDSNFNYSNGSQLSVNSYQNEDHDKHNQSLSHPSPIVRRAMEKGSSPQTINVSPSFKRIVSPQERQLQNVNRNNIDVENYNKQTDLYNAGRNYEVSSQSHPSQELHQNSLSWRSAPLEFQYSLLSQSNPSQSIQQVYDQSQDKTSSNINQEMQQVDNISQPNSIQESQLNSLQQQSDRYQINDDINEEDGDRTIQAQQQNQNELNRSKQKFDYSQFDEFDQNQLNNGRSVAQKNELSYADDQLQDNQIESNNANVSINQNSKISNNIPQPDHDERFSTGFNNNDNFGDSDSRNNQNNLVHNNGLERLLSKDIQESNIRVANDQDINNEVHENNDDNNNSSENRVLVKPISRVRVTKNYNNNEKANTVTSKRRRKTDFDLNSSDEENDGEDEREDEHDVPNQVVEEIPHTRKVNRVRLDENEGIIKVEQVDRPINDTEQQKAEHQQHQYQPQAEQHNIGQHQHEQHHLYQRKEKLSLHGDYSRRPITNTLRERTYLLRSPLKRKLNQLGTANDDNYIFLQPGKFNLFHGVPSSFDHVDYNVDLIKKEKETNIRRGDRYIDQKALENPPLRNEERSVSRGNDAIARKCVLPSRSRKITKSGRRKVLEFRLYEDILLREYMKNEVRKARMEGKPEPKYGVYSRLIQYHGFNGRYSQLLQDRNNDDVKTRLRNLCDKDVKAGKKLHPSMRFVTGFRLADCLETSDEEPEDDNLLAHKVKNIISQNYRDTSEDIIFD